MTDTEKIVTKTKEFILTLYSQGFSTHKIMVESLKDGIDLFVGRKENFQTIKDEILQTCLDEFYERTKGYFKIGHLKMAESIKLRFIEFVKELNVDELTDVLPIPYERRLTDKELEALAVSLKTNFDFGSWKDHNGYWEPLANTENSKPFIYFNVDLFKNEDVNKIIQIAQSLSDNTVFKLTEFDLHYEVETSLMNLKWKGYESAYCNKAVDWLIYLSHEGTITFAGGKLLAKIEKAFPEFIAQKNPWN